MIHLQLLAGPLQTGFEFKKRRAFPVITGIVIAAENEEALLEVRTACLQFSRSCPFTDVSTRDWRRRTGKQSTMPKRNGARSGKTQSSSGGQSSYMVSASGSASRSSMRTAGSGAVRQQELRTRSVTRCLAEQCIILIVFM